MVKIVSLYLIKYIIYKYWDYLIIESDNLQQRAVSIWYESHYHFNYSRKDLWTWFDCEVWGMQRSEIIKISIVAVKIMMEILMMPAH
jgi:hypothetical protein